VLFTSYTFVLGFLPIVLVLVLGASALGFRSMAKVLLLASSLVFYAWWNPPYVLLLLALLGFNFLLGSWLIRTAGNEPLSRRRLMVLCVGLVVNIGTLVYFKYKNFFLASFGDLVGHHFEIDAIILPLGISFITFQKIAFLVDAYAGQIKRLSLLDFSLFVSFFPQLIAGPIVHHREVIPQFEANTSLRYVARGIPIAITFLVIGAFKKVILADRLGLHVTEIFDATGPGSHAGMATTWIGALAFQLQVYFDFSGYSDMAIGLGLLFGIRLPFNFNSPLKASSIVDYWSRWHMTLTRFCTAYIYNPIVLRATRRRMARRKRVATRGVLSVGAFVMLLALPTLFTMFIIGLWHGAGFQFILFGLVHGVYLVINHAWRNIRRARHDGDPEPTRYGPWLARALTFIALLVAIPFFRADSAHTAFRFVANMFGAHGLALGAVVKEAGFVGALGLLLIVCQVLPNTQEIMHDSLATTSPSEAKPAEPDGARNASWPRLVWKPTVMWAIALALIGWYVVLKMAAPTTFLYFQF
jgi:D-alanyl-lipoteichoic acid acyltransferase DltB (MBOAT superfamily)